MPPTIIDQRHAEHDEADLAGLPAGVGERGRRQEVRDRLASANATSTSTITGIAVSIQRLARISPSAWSGQQR